MAGILIYTAAPDSEGTLGGLVTLGETSNLEQHLNQALECRRAMMSLAAGGAGAGAVHCRHKPCNPGSPAPPAWSFRPTRPSTLTRKGDYAGNKERLEQHDAEHANAGSPEESADKPSGRRW